MRIATTYRNWPEGENNWQVPTGAKCDRRDVLFFDLPPLDFYIFFLTCSVFLLDVVSKYYSCTRRGEPGGRQLGHEVNRLDMAGIAKPFAILALRHLLIYHYYLSIVGLSIDSLSHIPMYISSKLSWHVASFLEFPLASERERVFS